MEAKFTFVGAGFFAFQKNFFTRKITAPIAQIQIIIWGRSEKSITTKASDPIIPIIAAGDFAPDADWESFFARKLRNAAEFFSIPNYPWNNFDALHIKVQAKF